MLLRNVLLNFGIAAAVDIISNHRYLKKNRLPKCCYVPATSTASSKSIFVAATNSTKQTTTADGTCL